MEQIKTVSRTKMSEMKRHEFTWNLQKHDYTTSSKPLIVEVEKGKNATFILTPYIDKYIYVELWMNSGHSLPPNSLVDAGLYGFITTSPEEGHCFNTERCVIIPDNQVDINVLKGTCLNYRPSSQHDFTVVCSITVMPTPSKSLKQEEGVRSNVIEKLDASLKFIPTLKRKREEMEIFSDVEIICEKKRDEATCFKCHKLIIGTCSPVLMTILTEGEGQTGKLTFNDISGKTMEMFLDFMYQDGLENVELDEAQELLILAERFKVDSLKATCEEELIKILTVSNSLVMLQLAKRIGGEMLEAKARALVMANLVKLAASKDFTMLMTEFPDALLQKRE